MEFEVKGYTYQNKRMTAFQQSYVLKRLMPVFSSAFKGFTADEKGVPHIDYGLIAEAISKLSDEDSDYIFDACLSTVQRKQGDIWANIKSGKSFMFEDIDLAAMIKITVQVIQDNFTNFFLDLQTQFQAKAKTE